MALQIFGTRKCAATRKAERFFKERDIPYHFVDLAEKGISPGELAVVRHTPSMPRSPGGAHPSIGACERGDRGTVEAWET